MAEIHCGENWRVNLNMGCHEETDHVLHAATVTGAYDVCWDEHSETGEMRDSRRRTYKIVAPQPRRDVACSFFTYCNRVYFQSVPSKIFKVKEYHLYYIYNEAEREFYVIMGANTDGDIKTHAKSLVTRLFRILFGSEGPLAPFPVQEAFDVLQSYENKVETLRYLLKSRNGDETCGLGDTLYEEFDRKVKWIMAADPNEAFLAKACVVYNMFWNLC